MCRIATWSCSVLVVGAIGALLDTTIVAIADDLSGAFSRSVAVTQWVTTASLLAMGVVIPSAAFSGTFGSVVVLTALAVTVARLLPKGPAGVPTPPTHPDLQTKGTHDAHGRR